MNLENFLREKLRESDLPEDRLSFLQLPLYLQHVLHEVSRTYASFPDNYDRLIRAVLPLDAVVFATLNYDTILERRLEAATGHQIVKTGDYLTGKRWALETSRLRRLGAARAGHRVTAGR